MFFDGVNDYITFGAATNLNNLGVTNFTIECWFKRQFTGKVSDTGTGGFLAVPLVTKGMAEGEGPRTNMNYFFGENGYRVVDNRQTAAMTAHDTPFEFCSKH